jgi:glycosyltransferase involved in cell wall biosynthesis
MKNVLYISYDGMTDPLGQSQVLPYLSGLAKYGYRFTILSFEKKERYARLKEEIEKRCAEAGIEWVPLSFSRNPPKLAKLYDALRMRSKALKLHREKKFDMVHCRSYPSADVGLLLKRKKGTKFFFDMRGFWADEKRDGGSWNQNSFLFRRVYKYYKRKETHFIREADHIISLTEAGKKEMMTWPAYDPSVPISVIPCCADMNHFSLTTEADKIKGRHVLGLPEHNLVLSYLGSVGTWYMLDEMLELFSVIKEKYADAKFLFITHSSPDLIFSKLDKYKISKSDILLVEATRQEVPVFTKASDINISFIRAVYSKLSSSPTKLGEVLSMGIPVIVNNGVGDVGPIVTKSQGGIVINEFTSGSFTEIVNAIPRLMEVDPCRLRNNIREIYSLETGIALYKRAYEQVFN